MLLVEMGLCLIIAERYNTDIIEEYGMREVPYNLTDSYLAKRTQKVAIDNCYMWSEEIINIGVPQGSLLVPLLFIIFINIINISCLLGKQKMEYAEDSNFIDSNQNVHDLICRNIISRQEFYSYCCHNSYLENEKMQFSTKNISLNESLLIRINIQSVRSTDSV